MIPTYVYGYTPTYIIQIAALENTGSNSNNTTETAPTDVKPTEAESTDSPTDNKMVRQNYQLKIATWTPIADVNPLFYSG